MGDATPGDRLTTGRRAGTRCVRRAGARPIRHLAGLLALVLAAGGAACDDSFTPFEPGVQRLSVWGYLEVTRDTQWIRIGALRPTLASSGDSLPVQATLEDLTNGQIVRLQQTTLRFGVTSPMDSAGTTAHNFWTTLPIRPGASYHFRAQGAIASPVEAVVRVPADYRMEVLLAQAWTNYQDSLRLFGLPYVAFVTTTMVTVDSCGAASEEDAFAPVSDTLHDPHATPVLRRMPSRRPGCGPRYVIGRTLSVVGSGAAWAQPPNAMGDVAPGNITNGVGFLGGTLSKTIPYEDCDYVSFGIEYCRLHYDSTTVTLTGRVWDPVCAAPVPRARVTLQELDAQAPEVAKIRYVYSDVHGRFWISALEPGMRYAMTVHRNERPANWGGGPFQEYQDYQATLAFTSGQQATQDVQLLGHSFTQCPP